MVEVSDYGTPILGSCVHALVAVTDRENTVNAFRIEQCQELRRCKFELQWLP